eukprot:423437_1
MYCVCTKFAMRVVMTNVTMDLLMHMTFCMCFFFKLIKSLIFHIFHFNLSSLHSLIKQPIQSQMDDNKPTERHNDDNDNYSDADEQDDREHWSSRLSFWLGAVGSAVGLGNLWRFPYQCASWGGGAFIFAYLVALITIGMPLLTQELALG